MRKWRKGAKKHGNVFKAAKKQAHDWSGGSNDHNPPSHTNTISLEQQKINKAKEYQKDLVKDQTADNNTGSNRVPKKIDMNLLNTLAKIIYHTKFWDDYSESKKKIIKFAIMDNNLDLNKNIAVYKDMSNNNPIFGKSNNKAPYSLAETVYDIMLHKVHTMNVRNESDADKIINVPVNSNLKPSHLFAVISYK